MFGASGRRIVATMSERADTPPANKSELAVSGLLPIVSEGLANKDIATRLFVSPRTVQAHLSHVYTKLGLTSRVQLVQEAGRHS
jgi:DNA-binding NarL/FixJ family response regulator